MAKVLTIERPEEPKLCDYHKVSGNALKPQCDVTWCHYAIEAAIVRGGVAEIARPADELHKDLLMDDSPYAGKAWLISSGASRLVRAVLADDDPDGRPSAF